MTARISTALVLIPLVLVLIFYAPLWLFLMVAECFLLASLWELMAILPHYGARGYSVTYLLAFLLPWVWVYQTGRVAVFCLAGGLVLGAWSVVGSGRGPVKAGFPSAAANLMAFFYIGIPFALIASFHPRQGPLPYDRSRGLELVLVLVTIWASDSGAYFVGRALGKHKISPILSPNKSLEGYLAAFVFAVVAALLYGHFLAVGSILFLLLAGAVVGLAGMVGDLFESLLKRGAAIKDTSSLIPGHGGVLDRVDSLLFAFPAYYLFSILIE